MRENRLSGSEQMVEQIPKLINWDVLSGQYMGTINKNPLLLSLRNDQANGGFSGSPIKIQHYMDVMKFLSFEQVRQKFAPPIRILDVGAFLNLFSDFINNYNSDISKIFHATGIESSAQMCEISRNLIANNVLIEGDVSDIDILTDQKFDVIVLNNFFHLEAPFPDKTIRAIFCSLDRVLDPGGIIFYKYDNIRIRNNSEMIIVSSEGTILKGKDFLPRKYLYSNERYNHFWYIITKPGKSDPHN